MMMPSEQGASLQGLVNVFAYITTAAAWLALVSLVWYQREQRRGHGRRWVQRDTDAAGYSGTRTDTDAAGRFTFMLVWLVISVVWWTVNSVLRLFFGYGPPTLLMTLTKTVIELQAFFSIILLFYLQRRHGGSGGSAGSGRVLPGGSDK